MEKIRIITDSGSDLRDCTRPDVTVLPMTISFGQDSYRDGVDLQPSEFYEKLIESDKLPTTSLISPAVFEEAFRAAAEADEKVLVITLSSKLSGTYQSAVIAAADYADRVWVVDSCNVTLGEQILVRYAMELVDRGMTPVDIAQALEAAKGKIHIVGLLDTLEYLRKGGRIPKAAAMLGDMLAIKPVVTVSGGEVVLLGKARGSRNGNNYLIKEIEKANGIDFSMPFGLGYTGMNDATLQKYIQDSKAIWASFTDALPICPVGATIGTHVGPNAIVVAFFDRNFKA